MHLPNKHMRSVPVQGKRPGIVPDALEGAFLSQWGKLRPGLGPGLAQRQLGGA